MASKFILTPDEMQERRKRSGKKARIRQQLDKAFGWTKHTRERTRLSPYKPEKPE